MARPELLIPAGNLEKLRTAVLYGADAVYVGVEGLSLRARQAEFNLDDLAVGVKEAHQQGVKVYAALNIFARNRDLETIAGMVRQLAEMGIDGVIVSDPGVLEIIKTTQPGLSIHLSTQANTTNVAAVKFWKAQGVSRIVLARELTLAEIGEIAGEVPEMELEIFIHGAMCMAYSGRCYLSAYRNRRSSNQGDCTQPCRWEYLLLESTRPDSPLILEEDARYSYLLSSKDLCLIEYLPEVINSGVGSLKIEGRMKSVYYVAVVTRTYRWALNSYLRDPAGYKCLPEWLAELRKISYRGYTTGFYFNEEIINETNPEVKYIQTHDLAGTVLEYDRAGKRILVGVRNRLTSDAQVELLLPDATIKLDPERMTAADGFIIREAHNGYQVYFPCEREVPKGAVLRKKID
ncbi:MAG: U32 family peptidase [Firmicutes bacterium]|nr:U32 family peptidase [Bacillota bacterium]